MPCLTGNGPVPRVAVHGILLGDVLAPRVPVSAFWRYHVSLQRKKCCQQIIGLNDESSSVAVCIPARSLPDRSTRARGRGGYRRPGGYRPFILSVTREIALRIASETRGCYGP